MRRSTFISAALHGALLLWVVAAFPTTKLDSAPLQEIPVDLATPAEITKLKAGMANAKDEAPLVAKPKEEKPVAVKEKIEPPEKTEALPEKKPEPEPKKAEAPKKPEPKPEKIAKAKEPEPEPEKKPEPKKPEPKKAEAPKKPAPKKPARDFNADRIAALLNKIPDAAEEAKPNEIAEDAPEKPVRGQSNGTQLTGLYASLL